MPKGVFTRSKEQLDILRERMTGENNPAKRLDVRNWIEYFKNYGNN